MCKECKNKKYSLTHGKRTVSKPVTIDGIPGKTCTNCGNWSELSNFHIHKNGVCGRKPRCKDCEVEYRRSAASRIKERDTTYYHTHKFIYRAKDRRRRAAERGLDVNWTTELQLQVLNFFGGCALTGCNDNTHFDHVVPIKTGCGGTTIKNMVPIRADLNLSKGSKNIFEWFDESKSRFDLDEEKFNKMIEYLAGQNEMTVDEYRDYVYECHANSNAVDDAEVI
jgi:hypothetical protein